MTQYLAKEIIPHMVPKQINLMGGLLQIPVGDTDFAFVIDTLTSFSAIDPERVAGVLKFLGVANDGGTVDEDAMARALKQKIAAHGGKAKIAGVAFSEADVDSMLAYVKRAAQ